MSISKTSRKSVNLTVPNGIRPHRSLGGRSPVQLLKDWASARREVSTELQVEIFNFERGVEQNLGLDTTAKVP